MSIDFDARRWERVKTDSAKWWAGELKRPLIQMVMKGRDPGRKEPSVPSYGFAARYPDDVAPEQIADRWEYDLSRRYFLGDAYPVEWLNFGAGVMAAMLGCGLFADDNTVWFKPPRALALDEVELKFDPENKWFKRIAAVAEAAGQRLAGQAQIGMTDLGGTLDILSSFRPSEALLTDLIDAPETVEKLVWQTHALWRQYFELFDQILRKYNIGWTCWTSLFSQQPYYMFQCDFCYMIGPEMFERFVKKDLAASCKWMKHGFYHLDGIGELPHLDSILAIPELKGVQWIPGAGKPDAGYWPEVITKIRKAGKLVQFFGTMESFDALAEKTGSVEGVCLICQGFFPRSREKELEKFLLKYGAL
ncbi:MAG: hypothetical protein FWD61_04845 [Phycisphaerales bacterium]|nr:hypothetical protein [Phycisphaerales bacterium]